MQKLNPVSDSTSGSVFAAAIDRIDKFFSSCALVVVVVAGAFRVKTNHLVYPWIVVGSFALFLPIYTTGISMIWLCVAAGVAATAQIFYARWLLGKLRDRKSLSLKGSLLDRPTYRVIYMALVILSTVVAAAAYVTHQIVVIMPNTAQDIFQTVLLFSKCLVPLFLWPYILMNHEAVLQLNANHCKKLSRIMPQDDFRRELRRMIFRGELLGYLFFDID